MNAFQEQKMMQIQVLNDFVVVPVYMAGDIWPLM